MRPSSPAVIPGAELAGRGAWLGPGGPVAELAGRGPCGSLRGPRSLARGARSVARGPRPPAWRGVGFSPVLHK